MNDIFVPRVLVISFNCFLTTNSNGRTLMKLFENYPSEYLRQFYMSSDIPDYKNCSSYYRVTDEEAMKAFLGKKVGRVILPSEKKKSSFGKVYTYTKKNRDNQMLRYLRQKVWETGRWENKEFYQWIEEFGPEVIVLFSGNNAFIDKIAMKISKKYAIPIILYNCEDYFLKSPKNRKVFTIINKVHCDRVFKKTAQKVAGVIYNCEKLKQSYSEYFDTSGSIVLMNSANAAFENIENADLSGDGVVYLGNVSVGREYSLCEIADVLGERGMKLDVYGNISLSADKQKLLSNKNVSYHGCVSYEECCHIMQSSKLLIHCESFAKNRMRDIKHAFSTKIADSLASGICLFVYAPENIALTDYIGKTQSAVLVTHREELRKKLFEALDSEELRKHTVERALKIVKQNHSQKRTSELFVQFLCNVIKAERD